MELTNDFTSEHVFFGKDLQILDDMTQTIKSLSPGCESLSEDDILSKMENMLMDRINGGDQEAYFQLGLLCFEVGDFEKAYRYFECSKGFDFQSLYQLSVMLYDGLGVKQDTTKALEYMKELASSTSRHARHLFPAVWFNLGRAYFQGYGMKRQSDIEAERWWLMAADDGNPQGSIKAQCILGMYYSRQSDTLDLEKAFFWHSEACANASLESQGALGAMYLYGIGVKKNLNAAYVCLKDASNRGNVYAMGNLVALYYRGKLFIKAADLASRIAVLSDVSLVAEETDCVPLYIRKGIAMGCFYFATCLSKGLGVAKDQLRAMEFYSRSFEFDPDACAKLQNMTQQGII